MAVTPARVGPYVVERELGRGGMGTVFAAVHATLGRRVALKVLSTQGVTPEMAERFLVEARAAARLNHPNIVTLFELGVCDAGRPFLAMELVEGESLRERLRSRGPLHPREAARLLAQLARAVQHAHEEGVLHRDLKPANVLLARDGSGPRLTDFGLAKDLQAARTLTQTGDVLGTPAYMAPEQADGRAVDRRVDVYGLGATLYEALTGRPPFVQANAVNLLVAVLGKPPEPPSRLRPDLPPELEAICLRCLEKEPGRRYPTALALAEELERFLEGERGQSEPPAPAHGRGLPLALAGLATLLALAALGAALSRPGPPRATSSVADGHEGPPAPVGTWTSPASAPPVVSPPAAPAADAPPSASATWWRGPPGPRAREGQERALAYDPDGRRVLLFGGWDRRGDYDRDVWAWDGQAWRRHSHEGHDVWPHGRFGHTLTYDPARGRLVLFGGRRSDAQRTHDLWEWDGSDWARIEVEGGPGPRSWHSAAWDSLRGLTVVFGGGGAGDDGLWTWNGSAWARSPADVPDRPPPRTSPGLAYDERRGRLVLYGGLGARSGELLGDLWEWSLEEGWTRPLVGGQPPPPLRSPGLVHAGARGVLVFGGQSKEGTEGPDGTCWSWDGALWLRVELTAGERPEARVFHGMAWDARRGVAVVFGGRALRGGRRQPVGDLWELRLAD